MSGRGFAIGGEPSRVMASPEDVERLKVSGFRDEQIGNETHRIPDVSRKSLALLRFGQLPAVSGHDSRFGTFVQPGTHEWKEYFSTRKVVETTDISGARRVEVTSNIHDKLDPEQIIHQPITEINMMEAMDDQPDYTPIPGRERRPRRYQLVDLLTDTYIMDKFAFPENLMNSIKFMAVSDPDQAAAKAQAYMRNRPGSERITVVAGRYARSRQWACGSVKAHASRFPATIAASDAIVIGPKVSIFGPGEPSDKRWSVYGPAKYMLELMDVFKMVASAGTAPVMFSLGTELTVLDIDIHNGDEFESPTVELHSGSQEHLPMQSSPIVGEFLSAEGRMQLEMYKQNVDLVEVNGVPVASAVRISSRHVIVNSHVLAEDMKVGGQPAVPVRMLSKDLWLLRSSVRYDVAWPLRDPEIGESVAICYRRGTELQLSSPITVRSCDGHSIIMSKASDLRQGMSGGAIVALSDFSLLGLYDGVGATAALGLVFSQESFTDVCTMDRVTVADREEAMEGENSLFTRMKDKGLAKYLQIATSSIRPLYCGLEHVGMAYAAGDRLVTTCDPDVGPLSVGKTGVPRVYEDMGKGQFYTREHVGRGPSIVRKPSYGEEVFILGKDEEGPYFSSRKSRVIHVGLSAKTFAITDVSQDGALPFVGGLVVAVTDAAVLGQYVRQSVTEMFGEHGYCVGMHSSVSVQTSKLESDVATIEKMFPMLHPTVWDPHLLEEVLTHSSVQFYSDLSPFNSGMLPLAYIGAAAFRVAVGIHLREVGVPTSRWQVGIQARMSVTALAVKAEEIGLASMIRTGAGVTLASGGKPHADVLEALAGAVYLCETSETFSEFVQFLDLLTIE